MFDDFVAFLALDVRDKADATGVMFVGGVVQTLRGWRVTSAHRIRVHGHHQMFNKNKYLKNIIAPPQNCHGGTENKGVKPYKSTGTKPLLQ
jgi:hypothetical protein